MYKVSWKLSDGSTHVVDLAEEAYWGVDDCEYFLKNKGAVEISVFYNGVKIDNYLQGNIPIDFPSIFATIW
jgi:hypothetical protein